MIDSRYCERLLAASSDYYLCRNTVESGRGPSRSSGEMRSGRPFSYLRRNAYVLTVHII